MTITKTTTTAVVTVVMVVELDDDDGENKGEDNQYGDSGDAVRMLVVMMWVDDEDQEH